MPRSGSDSWAGTSSPTASRLSLIISSFWVVITGATDGIGKEFAVQLAKKGFNILLVSRSKDKLDSAASEIGVYFLFRPRGKWRSFLCP